MFRVLALGDIVGRPGRRMISDELPRIISEEKIDLVIVNGENASGGTGLVAKNAGDLFNAGVDVVTSGNHIWDQKGYEETFTKFPHVLRPANYPEPCPGKGFTFVEKPSAKVMVINLQGRVFMQTIDCPFTGFDRLWEMRRDASIVIVDFHAEVTSEKVALGWYIDGRASFLFGTHTHIQTADEHVLPSGTGYITDLGMCGAYDSVIGMKQDAILARFLTQRPHRFDVASGDETLCGAICDIDVSTGKAISVKRFVRRCGGSIENGD